MPVPVRRLPQLRAGAVVLSLLIVVLVVAGAAAPAHAQGVDEDGDVVLDVNRVVTTLAPGVTHETFTRFEGAERVNVFVLRADLTAPGVRADLLYPGEVARRELLSSTANRLGAIGGINGDFFDIGASNAPLGVAIAGGELLKSRDGFVRAAGVGFDGVGVVTTSGFSGTVQLPGPDLPLDGLNTYTLPGNGIGMYNPRWGTSTRDRPAAAAAATAVVRQGRVSAVREGAAAGPIPADGFELVANGTSAARVRALVVGDAVATTARATFAPPPAAPFRFALGGVSTLVRDGAVVATSEEVMFYPRAAIGFAAGGRTMILVVIDGRQATSTGLTQTRDFAQLVRDLGAADALHLDGGGSATMVVRSPGQSQAAVVNNPSDGAEVTGLPGTERPVPNGVGVFVDPQPAPAVPESPAGAAIPLLGGLLLLGYAARRLARSTA